MTQTAKVYTPSVLIFSNINPTDSNDRDSFIMCLNFKFVLKILPCYIVG
jgi:hypothetical protein